MKVIWMTLMLCLTLGFSACGPESQGSEALPTQSVRDGSSQETGNRDGSAVEHGEPEGMGEDTMQQNVFYVTVGGSTFAADFAENSGAQTWKELLAQGPVTLSMSDYGGFEKVGALGRSLPTSNGQTTTQAGDIVLYQGNQIVLFYGSNAWSYTRLGKIRDLTGWEETLGRGDVSVIFSID